jgi:peptidoglycan hydrolase-like protein with peptidoglycan-binding domain
MKVVISSGHGKYIRGAEGPEPWGLDEVDEARRVVDNAADIMEDLGVKVTVFHDDVSDDQDENLKRIVDFHNNQGAHDLDVSVHFNSADFNGEGSWTSKPVGTEVFYESNAGKEWAEKIVDAMADSSGLINRGAKDGSLYFLSNTAETAVLIEVCFVNSKGDIEIYHEKFDQICQAIATTIAGEERPPGPTPPKPKPELYPTLALGDRGPWVRYMQLLLGTTTADGDFGTRTEDAVEDFQSRNGLYIDGVCGSDTWRALRTQGPPVPPPDAFTPKQEAEISLIAADSEIADYDWEGQGRAPDGYTQGMALAYAQVYRKLKAGDSAAAEMAKANTHNSDKDVLSYYAGFFKDAGMDNSKDGADTLRHLWALMLGHAMLESSGEHCCGRDQSASNTDSNTCEAGLFQTSYNAHSCSSQFDKIMTEYADNQWSGYLSTFEDGVSCSSSDWECYGSGSGYQFQEMCKNLPAFSAETAAITLRNLRNHYGPINRYEVELRREADEMFKAVQNYVDQIEMVA